MSKWYLTDKERFESHIELIPFTECHIWTGYTNEMYNKGRAKYKRIHKSIETKKLYMKKWRNENKTHIKEYKKSYRIRGSK